jgi:hypothetical protein
MSTANLCGAPMTTTAYVSSSWKALIKRVVGEDVCDVTELGYCCS